jgi:hypothetical protein
MGNVFWADTVPKLVKLKLIRLIEGMPTLREFRQVHMAPIQSDGPMREYQVAPN